MNAPYRWHFCSASDETLIGVEGTRVIDFKDGVIELNVGDMLTISASVPHCTRSKAARPVNLAIVKRDNETIFCDAPARARQPSDAIQLTRVRVAQLRLLVAVHALA